MKTLRFRIMHETHPGLRRRDNEDAVALHPGGQLWAVADGMAAISTAASPATPSCGF
jgi:serine/threonine protein phosphatase PrpC